MNVTETAQKRIDDMLTFDSVFRIEIQGGGCTGFKYNFDITDVEEDESSPNKQAQVYKIRT